jgi:hypothetical protein
MELIKQPNGKYCSINWNEDFVFYNYTEEEVVQRYINEAKRDMDKAKHYGNIIDSFIRGNRYSGEILKELGFEQSFEELAKYIPRKPLDQSYAGCDFCTYAKCPACGGMVQDGLGHTDEKCKCGQLLKWK